MRTTSTELPGGWPGAIVGVLGMVGALSLAAVPAVAQPATAAPQAVPRMPWGAPALGGVWDFRTITPLERPAELAGRARLTSEEAASY